MQGSGADIVQLDISRLAIVILPLQCQTYNKRSRWTLKILVGHWTIQHGIQTAGHNKSFQSLVFVLAQWSIP